MSNPTPSTPGEAAGALSADGDWVWDGSAWEASTSPDGHWRWDGRAWTPLTAQASDQAAVAAEHTWPDPTDIDDAGRYASGSLPPKVDELPGEPLFSAPALAVGQGWTARRPLAAWHLLQLPQLRTIAVVPPTTFTQFMYSRSLVAPHPDLALRDQSGAVLRISVAKLDDSARNTLGPQIPSTSEVTLAASLFLRVGTLPGKWGKPFQCGPWRFG